MCDVKKEISTKLRDLRKAHGFTQQMLSLESGVSIPAISKIERGLSIPNAATLQKLTSAMKIEDALFWNHSPPTADDSLEEITKERDMLRKKLAEIYKIAGEGDPNS